MGKSSPAKWIKSVLLGKKGPKTKIAKGKEKIANEGDVLAVEKAAERNLAAATIASQLSDADSVQGNLEMNNRKDEGSPQNPAIPESELEAAGLLVALDGPERYEQEQSATKVQASFRGYLARRAYLSLKGIIKLQALTRGHFVRRRAVSTIHCMLGIVKVQAHVRGKRVRLSDIGLEVKLSRQSGLSSLRESKQVNTGEGKYVLAKNLSANVFALKFLVLSPRPLHLQYVSADPNSITSWMDRWSVSSFWKPIPREPNSSTALDQNQSTQSIKTDTGRAKRNNKLSSAHVDNGTIRSSFESDRSRRTFRKPSSHAIEVSDPETAKSELEKVKRNLRKVHESAFPSAAAEYDKPKQSPEYILSDSSQNVPEQNKSIATENTSRGLYDTLPSLVDVEIYAEQRKENGGSESMMDVQTGVDTKQLDNITDDDKIPTENEDSLVKQDMLDNEHQKFGTKGSFQAKHKSPQNGSNKQPKVPSYMLATKSAKAKLRDSSSLFEKEAPEKSPSTRRHSLPSATGTKVASSPKAQKLTPSSNRKAKNKSVKPLTASKDGTGKHSSAKTISLHFSHTALTYQTSVGSGNADWRR